MADLRDNPSLVLKKVDEIVYEDRPIPEIGDNDVLIEVKKTGICGSDVHYWVHGRIGDFIVNDPMVLGHESSGIVFKVGKNVKHVKPGSKVALEPGAGCRICDACKSGKYQLCPNMVFAATPPYDGTLARYYRLPADLAYELPENVSLEDGAMIEPLAVGIHSVSTLADLRANQNIAVFGAGPVGLLCMAVAKALGARRIVAVDINAERLAFAKSYAATDTFLPPSPKEGEARAEYSRRVSEELKAELNIADAGPNGIDVIIEASGAEVCIQTGLYLVKIGGKYVQVGMGAPNANIPIVLLLVKELKVLGSFRYGPGDYALAIALVAQGKIDLKPLVSHRFAFADAVKAFATTKAGKSEDGKGVIKAIIDGPL